MSATERRPDGWEREWAEERHVEAGRWRVRYREAGAGEPVVLVHGLGVSSGYWSRVGPRLAARGYRAMAPDLPGFGRTPGPRLGLSVGEQAAAIRDFVEALSLPAAAFVGHSLSCQAVLELAAAHPDLASALVLAGPTGAPGRYRLLRQARGLLQDLTRESLGLAAKVGVAYLQAGLPRVVRTWWLGAREHPLSVAPSVHCPTLVVVGDRDPVVPLSFARELAAALPDGRLAIVPGGAHAVIFTGAAEFTAVAAEFLDGRAG